MSWVIDVMDAATNETYHALLEVPLADPLPSPLPDGLPLRYVHGPQYAWDSPGVYVSATQVIGTPLTTTGKLSSRAVVPVATINIAVIRCISTASRQPIPTAAEVTAGTLLMLDDLEKVSQALMRSISSGTLLGTCTTVLFNPATPVGLTGLYGGWLFSLSATR